MVAAPPCEATTPMIRRLAWSRLLIVHLNGRCLALYGKHLPSLTCKQISQASRC